MTRILLTAALAALTAGPIAAQDQQLTRLTQFAELGEPLYKEGFEHFNYVNPDAPKGGEIHLWAYGTFETINTLREGQSWAAGTGFTGDTLMTGSADELYAYYPSIAESVEVPDDLSYAIFNINPAARWHDGQPITAADFEYAFDVISERARVFLRSLYEDIKDATALDERRIRFDFATTENWKTLGVIAGLSPMPKHYFEGNGIDPMDNYREPPVAEGAYRIAEIDFGNSITYERVPDYWAKDLPVNVGQYNFDRITYTYYRDFDVAFQAFKGGDIDFWSENQAQRWATGYDIPAIDSGAMVMATPPDNTPSGVQGFMFNTRRPKFADVRVREALGYLFDFEWMNRNIFYGQYERIRSYFPNTEFGVEDYGPPEGRELEILEPYRDQLPERLFTEKFEPPVTDGTGNIRPQLRQALALLREAGWEVIDGRLTNRETGEAMTIEFVDDQPSSDRFIGPYIQNLRRAGIEANFRVVDTAQYERITDAFDFDVLSVRYTFFPPPGPLQQSYFGSSQADVNGSGNYMGIKNPVVDALLTQLIATDDMEEMEAISRALDRVLLWNHYLIPQWYLDTFRIAYWDLFDSPAQQPVYGTGWPTTWWWAPTDLALASARR